jgi:hypothetical protein
MIHHGDTEATENSRQYSDLEVVVVAGASLVVAAKPVNTIALKTGNRRQDEFISARIGNPLRPASD